jgi:hypothetical protein
MVGKPSVCNRGHRGHIVQGGRDLTLARGVAVTHKLVRAALLPHCSCSSYYSQHAAVPLFLLTVSTLAFPFDLKKPLFWLCAAYNTVALVLDSYFEQCIFTGEMGDEEDITEENEQIPLPQATFIEDVGKYLEGIQAVFAFNPPFKNFYYSLQTGLPFCLQENQQTT